MSYRILLYGASGFSGQLIADVAATRWSTRGSGYELVLGARNAQKLRHLARRYDVAYRAFALDQQQQVVQGLTGIDLVINAAGPFALTAERLAKTAIALGIHYVDINGEVDVYKRLDDLDRVAQIHAVTVVCAAGHMSVTSDLLLDNALAHLKSRGIRELGVVRIAMSRIQQASRGSVYTALRMLREQVTVVRKGCSRWPFLWHVPVGQLQRTFDFGARKAAAERPDLRIASGVNLVDTLCARLETLRHDMPVQRIESYMETGSATRIGYQLGSMASPLLSVYGVEALIGWPASLLPEGPSLSEREASPHVLLLEIEDACRTRVIDWRLEGPNIYDITADAVTRVAEGVLDAGLHGWRTPAEVLLPALDRHGGTAADSMMPAVPLHHCKVEQRITYR